MSTSIRPIQADDYSFQRQMLYEAIHVPPDEAKPDFSIIDTPELARYLDGFGSQHGDIGFIAMADGEPVAAAWVRLIRGFAFIDEQTPELLIAVLPNYRGQGIGTRLIQQLFAALQGQFTQMSLSVDSRNKAQHLYQRLGFVEVSRTDENDTLTMLRQL